MDTKIKIIQGDITTLAIDAIVNAANPSLMGGGGVDHAIHKMAGPELKEACRPLRGCHTGDAKITLGFNLPARFVIHTVGPVWNNGTQAEDKLLASAYRRSLEVALENNLETIAFPSISTGAYRYPFDEGTRIGFDETIRFLTKHTQIREVIFVAFGPKDFARMTKIFNNEYQNKTI